MKANQETAMKGSIDPKGTVTVIDLTNQNVSHLDFTVFDSEAKRAELVQNGVILKKERLRLLI